MPAWLVVAAVTPGLGGRARRAEPTIRTTPRIRRAARSPRRGPDAARRVHHAARADLAVPSTSTAARAAARSRGGINDARTNTSTIPTARRRTRSASTSNGVGLTGAAADAEWNAVVQCMKEVYSPFDVTVTDVKPTTGVSYTMAIIAGIAAARSASATTSSASRRSRVTAARRTTSSRSRSRTTHGRPSSDRVNNLCWTAAQESAHAFGLDHEYAFLDGTLGVQRPDDLPHRLRRPEVLPQRQPRPAARPSRARATAAARQNSHLKLLSACSARARRSSRRRRRDHDARPHGDTAARHASSRRTPAAKRGVAKVELFLNGFKWAEAKGAAFGAQRPAQPVARTRIQVPGGVPNSIIDIVAARVRRPRHLHRLGGRSPSPRARRARSADTCAKGQKCEAGKCFWDPPTGELGDACTYSAVLQDRHLPRAPTEQQICTQDCILGVDDSCPRASRAPRSSPGRGVCCFPPDDGGCCSAASDRGVPLGAGRRSRC